MNFPPPTEKQARILWAALTGLAIGIIIALIVAAVWGLGRVLQILTPVLLPLAVAGVLAYLLDPVVDFFERKGSSRVRAILCVFALALVIIVALAGSVVPQLVVETRDLASRIPAYARKLEQRVQHWTDNPPALVRRFLNREAVPPPVAPPVSAVATTNTAAAAVTNAPPATLDAGQPTTAGNTLDDQTLQSAAAWLAKALPKIGAWIFGQVSRVASWFGILAGLALIPVYLFYLLLEKRAIASNWADYLPVTNSRFKEELVFVLKSINDCLIAFFRGQVLVAICDGILYTIGFLIIGLPYAVLIGAMAVILTMIPFLGAITTCLAALIIAFVQYGDWLHPLLVLVVVGVVQALESLVIQPKIMGDRVGLHPLTIIIAVLVGTTLMGGILGGVLAIPLTAALRTLMFRYVWKKRST